MNRLKYFSVALAALLFACNNEDNATTQTTQNQQKALDALNAATAADFPGLSLTVYTPQENFTLVSGKAKLPGTAMAATSLHYMQSIAKTFTAVAILKLKEQGHINLDANIGTYLPSSITSQLANGSSIKVRHLLNMTSGLPDYLENPEFLADIQTSPLPMPSNQLLSYVYNRPAHFAPGTSAEYSNINYHLLALIIDNVTGAPHSTYIKNNIIIANRLANTYYLPGSALNAAPAGTTASYITGGTGFEDLTVFQFGVVKSLIGDDGIVASTQDIATFYKKLLQDKTILTQATLNEMTTPILSDGEPFYGMGLTYYKTQGGVAGIGHPGAGVGAASETYYFPSKNITIVLATNVGTLLDSEKEEKFALLLKKLSAIIIDGQ